MSKIRDGQMRFLQVIRSLQSEHQNMIQWTQHLRVMFAELAVLLLAFLTDIVVTRSLNLFNRIATTHSA